MNFVDRLLLTSTRVTGMWTLGTPLEPLATGRQRVLPAVDTDIESEYLSGIERQLDELVSGLRTWLSWGVVLGVFAWIGSEGVAFWRDTLMLRVAAARGVSVERYMSFRDGTALVWLITLLALFLIWVGWIVRFIRHLQLDPSYEAGDRLGLALKRDLLCPESLEVLRSHRPSACMQVYFGKFWPR